MKIVSPNALETRDWSLRGTDGGKFGDDVIFSRFVQRLKLGRTRMSQMVEIKGTGNQALQLFICIPCYRVSQFSSLFSL
jgi:hypothetical protein